MSVRLTAAAKASPILKATFATCHLVSLGIDGGRASRRTRFLRWSDARTRALIHAATCRSLSLAARSALFKALTRLYLPSIRRFPWGPCPLRATVCQRAYALDAWCQRNRVSICRSPTWPRQWFTIDRFVNVASQQGRSVRRGLTNRSSGRVKDKVPSSYIGVRAAQLNR